MPAKKEWLTFAEWGRKWGKPPIAIKQVPEALMSFQRRDMFSNAYGTALGHHQFG